MTLPYSARIVSLNAWCGMMWDDLASWVPRTGADVLCVQEVTRSPGLQGAVRHADYLLISTQDAIHAFTIRQQPEVSDHRPLALDLRS